MRAFLLKTVSRSSLVLGSWLIRFIAWWIATGYFLFRPSRRNSSVRLYQAIFPDRRSWYYLYCAWRQFHCFAGTYAARIGVDANKQEPASAQGREKLVEVGRRGTGGIILISHLGSYEVAARAFQELGLRLLLIMGEKEAKQVARNQRETLIAQGVQIQVATSQDGSPFGGLEALKFIREGGFVSIAGDLVWTDQRSLVPVRFFNRDVGLPAGPHLLAFVSGAPLFTLFTFRVGKGRHQIILSSPHHVKAPSRAERNAAIQESVQAYAGALETMVRQHPFQWYIFEPFFRSVPGEGSAPLTGPSARVPGGAGRQGNADAPNP
jgi:predicted LPLAT superfamily acyltransferase